MSHLLCHYNHLNQHQSSLDPWYLEFSSCLNHGQTKTAKGSNRIIWSNNNNNRGTTEVQPGTKQGQPGTRQGQPGTKQGQPGTKQGQPGTKQGQTGTKQGQRHNWTNAKTYLQSLENKMETHIILWQSSGNLFHFNQKGQNFIIFRD